MQVFLIMQTNIMKKVFLFLFIILTTSSCSTINELLIYNTLYNKPLYRTQYHYYQPQPLNYYKHGTRQKTNHFRNR